MIPVYQSKLGKGGDCFRACVASLMEKRLDDVPDFMNMFLEDEFADRCYLAFAEWLKPMGFAHILLQPSFGELEGSFMKRNIDLTGALCIANGRSPRGSFHSVVYGGGVVLHDPVKGGGGILSVESMVIVFPIDPLK